MPKCYLSHSQAVVWAAGFRLTRLTSDPCHSNFYGAAARLCAQEQPVSAAVADEEGTDLRRTSVLCRNFATECSQTLIIGVIVFIGGAVGSSLAGPFSNPVNITGFPISHFIVIMNILAQASIHALNCTSSSVSTASYFASS